MSKVIVNGEFSVEGEFSLNIAYDNTQNPPRMEITGAFSCASGYLPEIYSLENDRYIVTGIRVSQESFGSEEDTIIYHFAAKAYGIADYLKEVRFSG